MHTDSSGLTNGDHDDSSLAVSQRRAGRGRFRRRAILEDSAMGNIILKGYKSVVFRSAIGSYKFAASGGGIPEWVRDRTSQGESSWCKHDGLRTGAISILPTKAGLDDPSLFIFKLLRFCESSLLTWSDRCCRCSRVVHGCSNPLLRRPI